VIGIGLNWSRPSDTAVAPGLDDQYTAELFYRIQLSQSLAITPDIQLIIDPALNPDDDSIFVAGLRVRLAL
jgi:porin